MEWAHLGDQCWDHWIVLISIPSWDISHSGLINQRNTMKTYHVKLIQIDGRHNLHIIYSVNLQLKIIKTKINISNQFKLAM